MSLDVAELLPSRSPSGSALAYLATSMVMNTWSFQVPVTDAAAARCNASVGTATAAAPAIVPLRNWRRLSSGIEPPAGRMGGERLTGKTGNTRGSLIRCRPAVKTFDASAQLDVHPVRSGQPAREVHAG